ncbi:MAG TPA: DUF58 domain-containing protein [Actinomycetota bacterium]|nr:DUF58 domain-containing protein [Actinomycetota bacterium]
MLTARAAAVLTGATLLWLGSRVVGSAEIHIVAVGLLALLVLAVLVMRSLPRDLRATRRISTPRAFPGARVRVDVDVENRGGLRTSLVLLEDRLPASLGPPARAVLPSVPAQGSERFSYHVTCRTRGRHVIGPLSASISDPFDLVRRQLRFTERHELVVYPEVEDLDRALVPAPPGGRGDSRSRQLFRTGEDFYTMRAYEVGDDLRRIHWPSVARTGELMIRQEQAARPAVIALFVDTRRRGLAATPEAFERGVSAAASVGELYVRSGYGVRLATSETPPRTLARPELLEALAVLDPTRGHALSPGLERLRVFASGGSTLVVVTHVPDAAETATLVRSGAGFPKRIAVLVHPRDRAALSPNERSATAERAEGVRISLARSGWDVVTVEPSERLAGRWTTWRSRAARTGASS